MHCLMNDFVSRILVLMLIEKIMLNFVVIINLKVPNIYNIIAVRGTWNMGIEVYMAYSKQVIIASRKRFFAAS